MTAERIEGELSRGLKHLTFAVLLCLVQYHRRRYFIIEHPAGARSWATSVMDNLLRLPRVERVNFEFCMAGMRARDSEGGGQGSKANIDRY